jgi:hypothetical protein
VLAAKLERHEMDPKRFMTFEPIEPRYEKFFARSWAGKRRS